MGAGWKDLLQDVEDPNTSLTSQIQKDVEDPNEESYITNPFAVNSIIDIVSSVCRSRHDKRIITTSQPMPTVNITVQTTMHR